MLNREDDDGRASVADSVAVHDPDDRSSSESDDENFVWTVLPKAPPVPMGPPAIPKRRVKAKAAPPKAKAPTKAKQSVPVKAKAEAKAPGPAKPKPKPKAI